MVSLHGRVALSASRRSIAGVNNVGEKPPDPRTLLDENQIKEKASKLFEWFQGKDSVLCITGAGLSTSSGIPDYRGSEGSYHKGHVPMIHQQYMDSEFNRKRYWGRSMVGWSSFDAAKPNNGHRSLVELEKLGKLGVGFDDQIDFYEESESDEFYFGSGHRELSIITQNVDSLHQRAGSKHIVQLHGNGGRLRCMNCGRKHDRNEFHSQLESVNSEWLGEVRNGQEKKSELRPDGDALIKEVDYGRVCVPDCPHCGDGFWKPDVVFFGDTVPKYRVALCQAAVNNADGILVVGSSLAVHSAFRHIKAANSLGLPIAILNVGETRAEAEGLNSLEKIEAPISETLSTCVDMLNNN